MPSQSHAPSAIPSPPHTPHSSFTAVPPHSPEQSSIIASPADVVIDVPVSATEIADSKLLAYDSNAIVIPPYEKLDNANHQSTVSLKAILEFAVFVR